MKSCPTCQRVYTDEMSYCLEDGAALVGISASTPDPGATLQIPAPRVTNQPATEAFSAGEVPPAKPAAQFAQERSAPERAIVPARKSNALPWVLGAVILGLAGIIIGMMLMRGRDDSQTANVSANQSANRTATPGASPAIAETDIPLEVPSMREGQDGRPRTIGNGQPTPTPKPSPSPRKTPGTVVAEEPPAPPQPTPTPATRPRGPISGGVLNGKAISLPRPAYPAIARAARASGTVTVQVMVDESGRVVSARAVGGHPLLQQAAVQAAHGARFAPTQLSGQPVKVTGVITYNFVAP